MILDIKFGEGGKDSKLFVKDLASAYLKYAKNKHLETEILETSDGQIIIEVSGKNVWKTFKHESGKHSIQRNPPTENKGRRHTSVVSVAVLPILNISLNPIDMSEVTVTTQKGTGPGGQNKNKTDSAVRMVHNPTGTKVLIDGRSQQQNRQKALEILTARIHAIEEKKQENDYSQSIRNQRNGGNRSGKVRTYNFIDSYVLDHNLNRRTSQIKKVMKGKFDLLLE